MLTLAAQAFFAAAALGSIATIAATVHPYRARIVALLTTGEQRVEQAR